MTLEAFDFGIEEDAALEFTGPGPDGAAVDVAVTMDAADFDSWSAIFSSPGTCLKWAQNVFL